MNALIAFYSWSGNTGRLAQLIQSKTGGALFQIRPVQPYPDRYNACVNQAKQEIQTGHRPELQELPADLSDYDIIFVGTPNWWSTVAPPIASFLEALDLAGKTVVPFCTHGGGGQARCASDMAKLCPDSGVMEGLAVYGGSNADSEVSRWLDRISVK